MKLPSEQSPKPRTVEEARSRGWCGSRESTLAAFSPAFAGNYLGESKVIVYDISSAFASNGNYVLSVAHIYRAFRAMGLLDEAWQDMEFAIAAYAPREPLVAKVGRPYDREQAQRHYLLAIGATPDDLSAKALRKAQRQGKAGVYVSGSVSSFAW